MKIVNNFGGIDKEIYNIGDILHKVGKNYLRALPIVCNEDGEDFEDYRIYGSVGGVGDDSGTAYGYEVDISVGGWSPMRVQAGTYIDVNTGGTISAGTYSTAFFTAPAEGSVEISIVDNYGSGRLLVYMPYDVGGTALTTYGKQEVYSGSGAHTMTVTVPSGAATIGVSHLNSDTDKGIKTTTPIYIGSSLLEEDEYIDYESGKIYRKKQVHTDTVTIDGIVWDILGYDHDTVYKSDNTLAQHSVTIQAHDVLSDMQFDAKEALFAFDDGLAAGTYHFTVGAQPWYTSDVGKTIQFTLAQAIPAGGQLVINNAHNATMIGATISVFGNGTATTATETVTMSEGSDGTDLGTVTAELSQDGVINSIQRALLGSNKWSESCMRQYLNSSASAGSVWEPKNKWDRPPSWAANTAGFLSSLSADFIANLGTTSKTTALNTVTDGGGTEKTLDKVFLLSRSEVYAGDETTGGEGAAYPYYSDFSDLNAPGTGVDKNRIKYRNGTAKYWWLRSPFVGYASNARLVFTTGALYYDYSAAYSNVVAPACCIVLDDIDTNDWLREKFLKPVDPPIPLPSLPTVNGKTTVNYVGMGTAPEKAWFSGMEFEIEDVYFGDKHIFSVWGEYDGTLPAQYSANGSTLADYRVYGSAGGVGDRTENLWNFDESAQGDGYVANQLLIATGVSDTTSFFISEYIPVVAGQTYTYFTDLFRTMRGVIKFYNIAGNTVRYISYITQKSILSSVSYAPSECASFTVPTNEGIPVTHMRISVDKLATMFFIVEGSTAPTEYVPFGYEVDMSVSDGTTSTTTPIYIGDEPLGEDEYVDYGEQKVHRRTENLFSPDAVLGEYWINDNHNYFTYYKGSTCWFIPIEHGETYTVSIKNNVAVGGFVFRVAFCDTIPSGTGAIVGRTYNVVRLNRSESNITTVTVTNSSNHAYIAIQPTIYNIVWKMLTLGSTAPSTYIPYLQPTDPPIPLPALPTVDGTTITDYAGQSAAVPSKFYAKYRKQNF